MLKSDHRVFSQISYPTIVRARLTYDPAKMCIPEAQFNIVWILGLINIRMVIPVLSGPLKYGALNGSRTGYQIEKSEDPVGTVRAMGNTPGANIESTRSDPRPRMAQRKVN